MGPALIVESVKQISANYWNLGDVLECELVAGYTQLSQYENTIATWKDGSNLFVLRRRREFRKASSGSDACRSDVVQLVHTLGTSSAVWAIGNEAFCKVKTWRPGYESEAQTIKFVREHCPQIPVPDIIYEYIDDNKSFLILRRVHGLTLRDAWPDLSDIQRDVILSVVVDFCDIMAAQTAPCLQSVTGKQLQEPYLSPSDKTGLLGPLTIDESISYFSATPSHDAPVLGSLFHFYHADLGPGNIIVSSSGTVLAILDWELAGFFPRFWISTKPSVSPGLNFDPPVVGFSDVEWRKRLRIALEEKGFPRAADWYMSWRSTRQKSAS
jgi:hypothetical protein